MEIYEDMHKFANSKTVKKLLERDGKTNLLRKVLAMEDISNKMRIAMETADKKFISEFEDNLRELFSEEKNKRFLEQVRRINYEADLLEAAGGQI